MSNAWEVTDDDIVIVLSKHGKKPEEIDLIFNDDVDTIMDYSEIEEAILHYTDIDDQTECSYSEIEDILIAEGILDGPKLFHCPS